MKTYKILDTQGNAIKTVESISSKEDILRNYPTGYSLREIDG